MKLSYATRHQQIAVSQRSALIVDGGHQSQWQAGEALSFAGAESCIKDAEALQHIGLAVCGSETTMFWSLQLNLHVPHSNVEAWSLAAYLIARNVQICELYTLMGRR